MNNQDIADRLAITDQIYRYCRSVDRLDIPLGHKISLTALAEGAAVKKFCESIGKASAAIRAGEHVHVHNLKSARQ